MKAIVIACLEPEHLDGCLRALALWVPPSDTIVANNATRPDCAERIAATAAARGLPQRLDAVEDIGARAASATG